MLQSLPLGLLALVWALVTSAQTGPAALPAQVRQITTVEGITKYRLANGSHFC